MAAATKLLARSGACVAVLNYDDLTLLASGFTVANIGGSEPIIFYMIVSGQKLSATVDVGQTQFVSFSLSVAITSSLSFNGVTSFLMAGVTEYGIGSA